jgi:hypothetical protein
MNKRFQPMDWSPLMSAKPSKTEPQPTMITQSDNQSSLVKSPPQKFCQLFWDYYGPSAHGTAEHFLKHLHTWLIEQQLSDIQKLEVLAYSDSHSAASCVIPFDQGRLVYQALKASRAYDYESTHH